MESPDLDNITKIRQQCGNKAIEAYGTSYIFERRASYYKKRLRILAFLGIAVPAAIGGIVLSFGSAALYLPVAITIAVGLGLLQLIGSIWSLVARWDDEYSYALESLTSNHKLSEDFKKLAENSPKDTPNFRFRLELIEKEDQLRSDADYKQGLTEKEKRAGMRAALRQFQRPCASCKQVPSSMKPSECEVCGNF